ncbi:nitrilase-related carbon-nitrogen hydrolase [Shimia abyssi]|uniref:nitrilase-related carbon-nitrogen hydrolase n=1 Tax=Shimia abyssi TaxID=1662395 RepID=UPI000D0D7AED
MDWEQSSHFVASSSGYENGIFMVCAHCCGSENDHEHCGLSCIVDPSGRSNAGAILPSKS